MFWACRDKQEEVLTGFLASRFWRPDRKEAETKRISMREAQKTLYDDQGPSADLAEWQAGFGVSKIKPTQPKIQSISKSNELKQSTYLVQAQHSPDASDLLSDKHHLTPWLQSD